MQCLNYSPGSDPSSIRCF